MKPLRKTQYKHFLSADIKHKEFANFILFDDNTVMATDGVKCFVTTKDRIDTPCDIKCIKGTQTARMIRQLCDNSLIGSYGKDIILIKSKFKSVLKGVKSQLPRGDEVLVWFDHIYVDAKHLLYICDLLPDKTLRVFVNDTRLGISEMNDEKNTHCCLCAVRTPYKPKNVIDYRDIIEW